MNLKDIHSRMGVRRAELMAELFLEDLGPKFLSQPTSGDVGYDFLVGFANKKGGTNTFAIQIAATERSPMTHFQLSKPAFEQLAHSNIPALLLVADVKHNRLYHAWLDSTKAHAERDKISVPVSEITDTTKKQLKTRFQAIAGAMAVAG